MSQALSSYSSRLPWLDAWVRAGHPSELREKAAERISVFADSPMKTSLGLRRLWLRAFPAEFFDQVELVTRLQKLELIINCLEEFPSGIGRCRGLTELVLDNNCFRLVPSEIGSLTMLTKLSFHSSYLRGCLKIKIASCHPCDHQPCHAQIDPRFAA